MRAGRLHRITNSTGENAYAYSTSVDEAMQAFLLDWGVSDQGHRRNLLQPNVSLEQLIPRLGIGIVEHEQLEVRPDGDHPGFRQPAQLAGPARGRRLLRQPAQTVLCPRRGQGNVQIDATNLATGATTSTTTWDAGGYALALAPGKYQVTASLNDTVIQTATLTIGTDNVEQDFILSTPGTAARGTR